MNSYKNIPRWENTRRIKILQEFHNDVVRYFDNCKYEWPADGLIENADAEQARQRINTRLDQATRIIEAAGIPQTVMWQPPPITGEYAQQIHVLLNLFELTSFRMPSQRAMDVIERALGVYRSDRGAALCRTINPFWWLFRGLLWSVRIPFIFLGAMGYDAARMEQSALGKLVKMVGTVLVGTSALLTILNYLGWLKEAKALLGIE